MKKLIVILLLLSILLISLFLTRKVHSPISNSYEKPTITKGVKQMEPITLERIFQEDHAWTATLSAEHKRVIIATGDVIPARSVNYLTVTNNNFLWPYEKTKSFISEADITFANLETPLLKNCPLTNEGMVFCGDARNIEGLVFAGVDIVSLANNHAGNHGDKGVLETVSLLKTHNIAVTGTDQTPILVKQVRGLTFAFLGYNDISSPQPGVQDALEERIKQDIQEAKDLADVVIVTFHWGAEYRSQPDDRQVYLGHFTIDSGADLVIGNHPHWIQPVEFYKGKLITYAHGNYIFDQMWSEETKKGVTGKYTFYDTELVDVEYIPIFIKDFGQATVPLVPEKLEIISDMKKESEILQRNTEK